MKANYYGIMAYHFLQHHFRIARTAEFTEKDLIDFVNSFYDFSVVYGVSYVDENGCGLDANDIASEILYNYATKTADKYAHSYYFSDDTVDELRAEFDKRSDQEGKLIYLFEEAHAKNNYTIKEIYSIIENSYKNSASTLEKGKIDEFLA